MNIRKPVNYSEMYAALDEVVSSKYEQIRMYTLIGQVVSSREEKGAAVAAAEYLQKRCPDIPGVSPRNLRRIRDFYRTCGQDEAALHLAMLIGRTQNVVILEDELTSRERIWYLKQVVAHGCSKKVLAEHIQKEVHLAETLDDLPNTCYTLDNKNILEKYSKEDLVSYPDECASILADRDDGWPVCTGINLCSKGRTPARGCDKRFYGFLIWGNRPICGGSSDYAGLYIRNKKDRVRQINLRTFKNVD